MMNAWEFLEKVKNKWIRFYRREVFKSFTHSKPENLKIIGHLTLINPNIKLGKNVTIYPNCMFFGDGQIRIGDNVSIGNNCIIYANANGGGVTIGNNTMIAANCYIIDSNHGTASGMTMKEQPLECMPIEIGNDVWLAAGCQIIKGAKINNGVVIGAGSLVNKEMPEYTICFGVPAKPHRTRE